MKHMRRLQPFVVWLATPLNPGCSATRHASAVARSFKFLIIHSKILQLMVLNSCHFCRFCADNFVECIAMNIDNKPVTADIVKITCDCIAQHIAFQQRDTPDKASWAIDQSFLLFIAIAGNYAARTAAAAAVNADIHGFWMLQQRLKKDGAANGNSKCDCDERHMSQRKYPSYLWRIPAHHVCCQLSLELNHTAWHRDFAMKECEQLAADFPGRFHTVIRY